MKIAENKTDLRNISEWGETAIGRRYNIGMWGERRREHLKNHRKALYNHYQMNMTLLQHLEDTQLQAQQLYETLIKQLAEKGNITEQLKAKNQMEWIRRMNNIRQRATEIVNREVVFK
ncbi:MAG: TnpV protein [Oscillospiraceae bacterium]|nr:TnpV protein [Oscillospiraceae bacterium]